MVAGAAEPDDATAVRPPMDGWVLTQPFGCTGVTIEPPVGSCAHFHSGVDLAAPAGTAVHAVLAGVALVLSSSGGYGLHVTVASGPRVAVLYGHLEMAAVITGELVSAGTLIGYEGSTGASTGPHLHLEVRRDGVPVDPQLVLPAVFARGGAPNRAALGTTSRAQSPKGESKWSISS
jgi:murein DD-endopeptidase MepM/ murein hydrolase activator NlpD